MVGVEVQHDANFLSQVLHDAPVPLWVIDERGLVALANRAATRFLGYRDDDDVVGGPSHDLLHPHRPDGSPYPWHECPIVGSTGSHLASEWFVTRAGDTRLVHWSTRRIGDARASTLLSFNAPDGTTAIAHSREQRTSGLPTALSPRMPSDVTHGQLRESMRRSIRDRFTDPTFSTADLAADAHLSVRSVQAIFAGGGSSPAAEIRRLRLDHARAMLEEGHSVQTACQGSGFLDPGTFARTFRQRFGLAPSQVQRTTPR